MQSGIDKILVLSSNRIFLKRSYRCFDGADVVSIFGQGGEGEMCMKQFKISNNKKFHFKTFSVVFNKCKDELYIILEQKIKVWKIPKN